MPEDNYPSASSIVRNLADMPGRFEVLEEHGKFRVVRVFHPFYGGYEFWVVNERGFLWEPAADLQAAKAYLESDEALAYEAES